jgi:hypothetical protein
VVLPTPAGPLSNMTRLTAISLASLTALTLRRHPADAPRLSARPRAETPKGVAVRDLPGPPARARVGR